jgi:methionyl-tRNA formyltransferase
MNKEKIKIVFFGSSEFSVFALEELKLHSILPELVVTTPDKPKGRKLIETPTPVKVWAQDNNIEFIDPASLKKDNTNLVSKFQAISPQLFLVASYGKIISKEIFEIPERKTLNIHPSLLPKYRGASPIQSQILNDEKEIGVTIMQIDEEMDHGPIVVQKRVEFLPQQAQKYAASETQWPLGRKELEKVLAVEGARLLAHILPEWMIGAIDPIMQNEKEATYCQKIKKEDGELQIDFNNLPTGKTARQYLLKIKAFEEWPTAYFFVEKNNKKVRIIITDATLENPSTSPEQTKLKILRVIPEGKKEMPFEDFLRGQK